jgi:O-antigen/teichoic acid export membrane protein
MMIGSNSKILARSVVFQVLSILITGIVSIALVPLIISLLGIEAYGVLEIIVSLAILNFVFEFGLGSTIIKYLLDFRNEGAETYNQFLWTYFNIKTSLAIIALLVSFVVALNFNLIFNSIPQPIIEKAKLSVVIFGIGIILSTWATYSMNMLKGLTRFDLANIVGIVSQLVTLSSVYFVKIALPTTIDIIYVSCILFILRPSVVLFTGMVLLLREDKNISFRPRGINRKVLNKTIGFLGGSSLITIVAQSINRGPKILIGMIQNPTAVAAWAIAEKLRNPIQQIQSSILRPLIPIGNLLSSSKQTEMIIKINKYQMYLIGGVASMTIIFIPNFISIWIGDEFNESILIIRIWFLGYLLPNVGTMSMFYYSHGKTSLNLKFTLIYAVIGLPLGIYLTAIYGPVGFAIGLLAGQIVTMLFQLKYFTSYFSIRYSNLFLNSYLGPYITILLAGTINYFLSNLIQGDTLGHFIIIVATSCFVFMLSVLFTMTKQDKEIIHEVIKKRTRDRSNQ